ncbi:tRNA lysidine(34) synthetase TilS [Levilactobacillus bambusae]|uniref:tRNA lysidine(34) synthetase TilS n=1 Tax=Levilactobacillus bambusae TaxID=2024736 RepID=UPI001403FE48|nr:tRNA lysidine(34) synthetase TilS [Levilactobacillus bambusae]
MNLQGKFLIHAREMGWTNPNKRVLIALSGGVDSMVLLHLFLTLPEDERPQISAVHIHHHLRAASDQEATALKALSVRQHFQLIIRDWAPEVHPKSGIEAAARHFRYQQYGGVMEDVQADWVATAHHADDQAETILMKWVRGGEIAQLRGILPVQSFGSGELIRPLLSFSKADLRDYAMNQGLTWFEDATNQSQEMTRNRMRQQVIPRLKVENPQFLAHVEDYAGQLTDLLEVANLQIERLLAIILTSAHPLVGSVVVLSGCTDAQQRLVIQAILKQLNPELSVQTSQVAAIQRLITNQYRTQGTIDLGHGWRFFREYDQFGAEKVKPDVKSEQSSPDFMLKLNHWYRLSKFEEVGLMTSQPNTGDVQQVWLTPSAFPVGVRPWQPGDKYRLANGHHQAVARLMVNDKVPQSQRNSVNVVSTHDGTILQVIHFRRATQNAADQRQTGSQPYYLVLRQHYPKGD